MSSELDRKISALPHVTGIALADVDKVPVVAAGVTSFVTIAELQSRLSGVDLLTFLTHDADTQNVGMNFTSEYGGDLGYTYLSFGSGGAFAFNGRRNLVAGSLIGGLLAVFQNAGVNKFAIDPQGVVTLGYWQASVIEPEYIGTGTPAAGSYVDGATGAWTPLPAGGGGGSVGVPLDLTGAVAGPMATWRNTDAASAGLKLVLASSSMFDNTYSFMATDAGETYRAFQVFADEAQLQLGQTPATTKWFTPGSTTTAPSGSNGPVKGFDPGVGLMLFGTPGIGDANIWFVNNGNSTSPLTMSLIRSSGDGGVRFEGNRYTSPERAGLGTFARTALDVATFDSAATLDDIEIGDSIWVNIGGTVYGYTIRGKLSATTARLYSGDPGGTFGPMAFTIRSTPSANRDKMSSRFGWDSQFNRFMFSTYQAPNSTYTGQDDWAMVKDGQLVIYPGGWDVPAGGAWTSFTDFALTGRGRIMRFSTSNTSDNDSFKPAIEFGAWYTTLPNTGGTITAHGKMKLQGGWTGERAPLRISEQRDSGGGVGAPAGTELEPGDIWRIGNTLYMYGNDGVTRSITFA